MSAGLATRGPRLRGLPFVPGRRSGLASYIGSRTKIKPATKEVWRQGEFSLLAFFGSDRPLAPMTIQKRLRFAKAIFLCPQTAGGMPRPPLADHLFVVSPWRAAMP